VVSKGLNLLMLPVYTRVLTTAEYGTVEVLVTCAAVMGPVGTAQLETALFRFLVAARDEPGRQRAILSTVVCTALPAGAATSVLIWGVGALTGLRDTGWLAGYVMTMVIAGLATQVARGLGRTGLYALSGVTAAGVTVACNWWLVVWWRWGPAGMMASLIAGYLLATMVIMVRLKAWRYIDVRCCQSVLRRELLRYSWPLVPSAVAWWVVTLSNRLVVATVLGVAAAGVYAVAGRFALIMEFAVSVFALSWAESASVHIDDPDRSEFISSVFDKGLRVLASGALLVVTIAGVLFQPVVGRGFADAYPYVPVLVLAAFFHGVVELYTGLYIATKRTSGAAKTSLWAAAVGTVAGFAVMAIARHHGLRKMFPVRYSPGFAAAVTAAGCAVGWCYYQRAPMWLLTGGVIAVCFTAVANQAIAKQVLTAARTRLRRPA
jgi:O-antigen/teichoic acid export membrane protein